MPNTTHPTTTLRPVAEIAQEVTSQGGHFFDPETLRFWGTRLARWAVVGPGGCFFVTSERGSMETHRRRYTVRRFAPGTARVSTVGSFRAYSTGPEATAMAKALAEGCQDPACGLANMPGECATHGGT